MTPVSDSSREVSPPSCPVCDTEADGPIESFTTEEAAAHFCSPTRDQDRYGRLVNCIGDLWPEDTCEIYRCPSCGFGFGYPFVGGGEEFYGILHEQMGYPRWTWDFDVALSVLEGERPGRILDIGAGDGQFLSALDEEWSPHAVEASEATRVALEKQGIETYNSVQEVEAADSFRCVTIFQTLEHISEYEEVLQRCQFILEEKGTLIITVPKADEMFKQEKIVGWPDMPPNHINKWSPESLRKAIEQEGFEVFSLEEEPRSIDNVKSKLHMRLRKDAREPGSIASQVYRLPDRTFRKIGLAALAPFALVRMVHELPYLFRGGAFCMAAKCK